MLTVYEIVALPAPTPVTTPVLAFTCALVVELLVHVPPASPLVVSATVGLTAIWIVVAPLIVPGFGAVYAVSVAVRRQPVVLENAYVITVVPTPTAVMIPDEDVAPAAIVATDVLLLLHTPFRYEFPMVAVTPTQTPVVEPEKVDGNGLIVTTAVVFTLDEIVYVTVTTPALAPPVITALLPLIARAVANALLLVDHVPPEIAFDSVVVPPLAHTASVPVMPGGAADTVTLVLTEQPAADV